MDADTSDSIKRATIDGVRWVVVARAITDGLALAVAVALARMIEPDQFGRAAVALIFVPLAAILTFEGFASALVQRPTFDESHRRSATLTSLAAGAMLSALLFLLAQPIGGPVFGLETADLLELISPVFVLAAIGAVPRATLWRRLDFRRMSIIDVLSMLTGTGLSLALAIAGLDAEAIVLGALATTASCSALLFLSAPSPWPRWHRRSQREITGFGFPAALAGLVHVAFNNADYAILAWRLSATQAGIYWRAFNLGVVYQDKLSGVMLKVAFPVYSRTESREELRRLHSRATRVLATVIFPLLTLLIVLAPVLIPFAFGPAWEPAVVPAQILAVAGMVSAILTGYPQVMLAVGQPKALLRFNLAMLGGFALAIGLASGHGLVVVAIAVVAVYFCILLGAYRFLLQRHAGIPMWTLLRELGPAVAGCFALGAVALPVRLGLEAAQAPAAAVLILAGIAGLVAYALLLRTLFRPAWHDVITLTDKVAPPLGRAARRAIGRGRRPVVAQGSSA
jgi:O-antigen/teichoic acid export membrane protein